VSTVLITKPTGSGSCVSAYTGVAITAAADLSESGEFDGLNDSQRHAKAVEAQISWLASHLSGEPSAVFDVRWLNDPSRQQLRLVMLARVDAANPTDAARRAAEVQRRLLAVPTHVSASPISDRDELAATLSPFAPIGRGMVEIRKRCLIGHPNRPDARVRMYLAVQPFTVTSRPWTSLLAAMATHPAPLILSVGLMPASVPNSFTAVLDVNAANYARLARDGEWRQPGALYHSSVKLTPEPFAIEAERLFTDAWRRYRDRVFRIRIQLCSPEPINDSLAHLVGTTISPPETTHDNDLISNRIGAAYALERPVSPADQQAFTTNLVSLTHRNWGGEPHIWQQHDPPHPHLRDLCSVVDAREAAAAIRLPVATHGAVPGFPVRKPGLYTRDFQRSTAPAIELGTQIVGERAAGPIAVPLASLTTHALFVGTTGSGKTNSILHFLRQLWARHRIPFLVIEPVNAERDDYRWFLDQPGFEDLLIFTVGDERCTPFRLNPFAVTPGVLIRTHIANLLTCFDAAFGLWDPLPYIYQRALNATYRHKGFQLIDPAPKDESDWPVLEDFVTAMKEVTGRLGYAGEVKSTIDAASILRAESLATGASAETLASPYSFPMAELLSRPVVMELAQLGDNPQQQSLVAALLLNALTAHYKQNRSSSDLAHVTVIEEAHRLLANPSPRTAAIKEGNAQARAAEAFANTLAENRKYGEGLIIVDQDPSKLIPDSYKNTNLKVMHRLPARTDRQLIGSTMNFSADHERYGATLETFEAFAFHDQTQQPVLIRVPNVRDESSHRASSTAELPTEHDLATRFHRFIESHPEIMETLAPYPDCAPCRFKCRFHTHTKALTTQNAIQQFKQLFQSYPGEPGQAENQWWADMASFTTTLGDPIAPHGDPSIREDFDACLFIHLMRSAYDSNQLTWSQLFRKHRAQP